MDALLLRPERILYVYMASCISVLVFNIAYIFLDKFQQKSLDSKRFDMVNMIQRQLTRIENKEKVSEEHLDWLSHDLKKLKRLKTFENSMDEVRNTFPQDVYDIYCKQLRKVFLNLVSVYEKRDEIEKAYFAKMIEKFSIDQGQQQYDAILDFLLNLVVYKDVFVRENALRAIFSVGNKEIVLSAWNRMADHDIHHNAKLLSDGLLRFKGDKEELITVFLKHLDAFDARLVLPILQFIRFYSSAYQVELQQLLIKETTDKELRLEALRYFRKYPYEPVREDIQRFLRYQEYVDWEYVAVAAQSLSSYPGLDTIHCLKDGLKASNWYIRLNCAESLILELRVSQVDLFDVYNGADRYAREILQYVTDKMGIKKQEMELSDGNI